MRKGARRPPGDDGSRSSDHRQREKGEVLAHSDHLDHHRPGLRQRQRSGVGKVVAALKGAMAEVEATQGEVSVPMSDTSSGESRIFLVHGHAEGRKFEVARFIEQETGEWPVILHEQADQSQTIIEKLERHGSAASFAVVLLTADDAGKAQDAAALSARARQNVVFEHGYFIGKLGRKRVVALYEDGVELPSDLSGVLYTKLSGNWKSDLLTELRAARLASTGTAATPAARQGDPASASSYHAAVSLAEVKTGSANGSPAYTATWRHTSEGMDAAGATGGLAPVLTGHEQRRWTLDNDLALAATASGGERVYSGEHFARCVLAVAGPT